MLNGHASVAMKSEKVVMHIKKDKIRVDCMFKFHNSGPTSVVRVGFPDRGEGAQEPYQGVDIRPKNMKGTFDSFESWVDGKQVVAELVPTDDRTLFWHAKTVTFKANSDCEIDNYYTLQPGAQVTSENGMYQQTEYVLHTGSSWHGQIGQAEIVVNFSPDVIGAPIHLVAKKDLQLKQFFDLKWSTLPKGTVIYEGPCAPTVEKNTLRFFVKNIKPTEHDDIHLYYAYRQLNNGM